MMCVQLKEVCRVTETGGASCVNAESDNVQSDVGVMNNEKISPDLAKKGVRRWVTRFNS